MLTLYTDMWALSYDFIRPNYEIVRDADTYFNQRVRTGEIRAEDCEKMIKLLSSEKEPVNRRTGLFQLSTSCKTLVLADKYPDIIVSNQNISEEASLYLLSLFADSNRAFLYAPAKQTLLFSLSVGKMGCDDIPFPIIEFDEEISAAVVRGVEKKICGTYGEIVEALDGGMVPINKTSYPIYTPVQRDEEDEEDGVYEVYDGENEYNLSECDKPMSLYCDREGCPHRVRRVGKDFILGGKFICNTAYDDFMRSALEVLSPFDMEPTDEQLEEVFEYAKQQGLIETDFEISELECSDVVSRSLYWASTRNKMAVFYTMEDGQPQIVDIYLRPATELKKKEEESCMELEAEQFWYEPGDESVWESPPEDEDEDPEEDDEDLTGFIGEDEDEEEDPEEKDKGLKGFLVEDLDDDI